MLKIANYIMLLFLLAACEAEVTPRKSESDKLPEATTEGLGTFGCLVNGKAMITHAVSVTLWDDRYFVLEAEPYTASSNPYRSDYSFLFKLIDDPFKEGTYHLSDSSLTTEINEYVSCYLTEGCDAEIDEYYNGKGYVFLNDDATGCEYYSDGVVGKGFLNITFLDRSKRIISGTFNFLVDTPGCRGREVTIGRFDVTYSTGFSLW